MVGNHRVLRVDLGISVDSLRGAQRAESGMALARRGGSVVSQAVLLSGVRGEIRADHTDILRPYLCHLPWKLEENLVRPRLLRNERGLGYRLAEDTKSGMEWREADGNDGSCFAVVEPRPRGALRAGRSLVAGDREEPEEGGALMRGSGQSRGAPPAPDQPEVRCVVGEDS